MMPPSWGELAELPEERLQLLAGVRPQAGAPLEPRREHDAEEACQVLGRGVDLVLRRAVRRSQQHPAPVYRVVDRLHPPADVDFVPAKVAGAARLLLERPGAEAFRVAACCEVSQRR